MSSIYVFILHHSLRPTETLWNTLRALNNSAPGHRINQVVVLVQGPGATTKKFPPSNDLSFEPVFLRQEKNLGIGPGFRIGVDRFLRSKAQWFAKIDDDIIIEPRGWSILIECIAREERMGKHKLFGAMMAAPRTKALMIDRGPSKTCAKGRVGVSAGCIVRRRKKLLGCDVTWCVTDYLDVGCTIYKRAIFQAGCLPDPRYYIAGLNLDLALQIEKCGHKGLLCTNPRCGHDHRFLPRDYRKDRYARFEEGEDKFKQKWGVEHRNLKKRKKRKP